MWPLRQSLGFLFPQWWFLLSPMLVPPLNVNPSECSLDIFLSCSLGIYSHMALNITHELESPNFSLAQIITQTSSYVGNCLFDNSTWISNRHLKFYVSKIQILDLRP